MEQRRAPASMSKEQLALGSSWCPWSAIVAHTYVPLGAKQEQLSVNTFGDAKGDLNTVVVLGGW